MILKTLFSKFTLGISLAFFLIQPAYTYSIKKTIEVEITPDLQLPGTPNTFGTNGGNALAISKGCIDREDYFNENKSLPLNSSASARCTLAEANADSESTGSFNMDTNIFEGVAKVTGDVTIVPLEGEGAGASAGSFAQTTLSYTTLKPDGTIHISLPVAEVIAIGKTSEKIKDPVSFLVEDINRENIFLEGDFFELIVDFENGILDINNGLINFINVIKGNLTIKLDNPFIDTSGRLLAEINNGILVKSEDSGIFDGLLPMSGTTGTFNFLLPDITFNYSLPEFDDNISFTIATNVEGSASASVPENNPIFSILAFGTFGIILNLKRKQKDIKVY